MRGYGAALILPDGQDIGNIDAEIASQDRQNYITITLEEGKGGGEFDVIPNAYKALLIYMSINRIKEKQDPSVISGYEHEYFSSEGTKFMDIYIAIKSNTPQQADGASSLLRSRAECALRAHWYYDPRGIRQMLMQAWHLAH